MLDPVADRILILPIAIYSLYADHKWLLLIMLLAELAGAWISMFEKSKESNVKPNIFGKTKMVLWSLVFVAVLIAWPNVPDIFFIDIIWISLIFSFLSILVKFMELNKKRLITNKFITKEI